MASYILDSQLHAIGRHLVRVDRAGEDVRTEIRAIIDHHCLVPERLVKALENDAYRAYEFERDRELTVSNLNTLPWAMFAVESHMRKPALEASRRALEEGLLTR